MRTAEYINGKIVYRDMTEEEIAEYNANQLLIDETPTEEERLSAIEDAIFELASMLSEVE